MGFKEPAHRSQIAQQRPPLLADNGSLITDWLGTSLESVLAEVLQLRNGLLNIVKCGVFARVGFDVFYVIPPQRQLLDGRNINIAVMEIPFHLGHVLEQKTPILTDAVPAQG